MEKEEIEQVLDSSEEIEFEEIPIDKISPINTPVKEGKIGVAPSLEHANSAIDNGEENESPTIDPAALDAPEQPVNESETPDEQNEEQSELKIPEAHAQLAANSFIGIANNFLEIGGGFFVKIKKSNELIEFDEAIKVIDEQNKRNIERIKLDEEDKMLLQPLLVEVLKKRAQLLTPEQQLIAAIISILIKKAKTMVEIKQENKLLEERIRAIILESKTPSNQEVPRNEKKEEPQVTDKQTTSTSQNKEVNSNIQPISIKKEDVNTSSTIADQAANTKSIEENSSSKEVSNEAA